MQVTVAIAAVKWRLRELVRRIDLGVRSGARLLREQRAQGTTEYAILVGVLVVLAILAIVAFRGKVEELWTSIQDGINKL
nr:hypothetical protein [Coriobacterium glomerans]